MAGLEKKSVLFVCLGNICRSPMAEAVFRHLVNERNLSDQWTIDSAATSTWEIGRSPDKRGQRLLKSKKIPVKHIARQWLIESCGIMSWHVGKPPDSRTIDCLEGHNITCGHRGRQVTKVDFTTFDFIFGMDEDNMRNLGRMAPKNATAKMMLLGSHDPEGELIIEDPYYDGPEAFEAVFVQVSRCCKAFLDKQNK